MTPVNHLRGISKTQGTGRAKLELLVGHIASPEGNADGSTEFRCAPGVLSGEHCLVWVEVAVSFVQAAAQYGSEDNLNNFASDVAGLLKFIRGASVEGMNKPELLSVVFDGCKGKVEEIAAEPATPTEEGEDLDMEIRAKVDGRIGALPKSLFT